MANTPVYVELPEALTDLTIKLYGFSGADTPNPNDDGFDNISGPDSLTEFTNLTGLYYTFIDEALDGWHYVVVNDLTVDPVATGWVNLSDTVNAHYVTFDTPDFSALAAETANNTANVYYNIVTRGTSDNNSIYFEWPANNTVTARKSLNGGPYTSLAGNVSMLRQEGDTYLFQMSYSSADRPSVGVAEYELTDGSTTRYLPLAVDSGAANGGDGLFQVNIVAQDPSNNRLQGARINVDTTTLTQTTNSLGEAVFNLDSGVYLLTCSPPAGYDTPSSQVVTITNADVSIVFTLTETDPDTGDCSPPWIG